MWFFLCNCLIIKRDYRIETYLTSGNFATGKKAADSKTGNYHAEKLGPFTRKDGFDIAQAIDL